MPLSIEAFAVAFVPYFIVCVVILICLFSLRSVSEEW